MWCAEGRGGERAAPPPTCVQPPQSPPPPFTHTALLLLHTPSAWTADDSATRRAAARLATVAVGSSCDPLLAPAVAVFALPLALHSLATAPTIIGEDMEPCADAVVSLARALAAEGATIPSRDAATIADAALAAATPPDAMFADMGGHPVDEAGPGAAAWGERAAVCVRAASAAVAALPADAEKLPAEEAPTPSSPPRTISTADVSQLWNVAGQRAANGDGATVVRAAPRPPLIQVIGSDSEPGVSDDDDDDAKAARAEAAAVAAARAAVAAAAADADRARADTLLLAALYTPEVGLDGVWATGPPAGAAADAVAAVARGGSVAAAVAHALPRALSRLHATLVQDHWRGLDAVKMTPYTGLGVFARALAARQLAWLVRCLDPPSLPTALAVALPALLAAASDPAPAVQRGGAAGLAAVAAGGPAAVAPHAGALRHAASRAVVGCADRAWPAAAPAAVALVVALDGGAHATSPPTACDALLDDWLVEGERHAHEPPRARVWAAASPPLLSRLGCTALRQCSRLMPLLLEWVVGGDSECRQHAAVCVAATLRAAWPRAHAHAAPVWRVLERGNAEAVRDGDGEGVAAIVGAGRAVAAASAGRWTPPTNGGLAAAMRQESVVDS